MGTSYRVLVDEKFPLPKNIPAQVHAVLNDVDTHMSTWRGDSELSLFNNGSNDDWQRVSTETASLVAYALDTHSLSAGAFDVTVGPMVDLWGFGAKVTSLAGGRTPSALSVSQLLSQVGSEQLDIDLASNAIRKRHPQMRLDLSGIAKGHAVDRVAELLDAAGIKNYLVELGGEIKSRGEKLDGAPWRVAIERPSSFSGDVLRTIELKDAAIATSGDYRNFFLDEGTRYSHTIDPRTGNPVRHQLASVSVAADSCMIADAFSTAMMVLGPEEAIDFAEQQHVAAQFVLKSEDSFKEEFSSEFKRQYVS